MLRFDHSIFDAAVRDLSWMTGNTFLAWIAVLLAWTIGSNPLRARRAGLTLAVGGGLLAAVRGFLHGIDPASYLLIAGLVVAVLVWSSRARARDRWARWLAIVGVVAFTPNAPYVLTDLYHFQQDIRATGNGLDASVVFAVQYGAFVVPAVAAWIVLLDLGRGWLAARRPQLSSPARLVTLTAVSLVCAFGVYLGRIERYHSWHPLVHPQRFASDVFDSLTHRGPIVFTLVWTLIIALVGLLGLGLLDRARRHGAAGHMLIVPLAGCVTALLLAGATVIGRIYHLYDVAAPLPSQSTVLACVTLSVVVALFSVARVAALTGAGRERVDVMPEHGGREWSSIPLFGLAGAGLAPVLGVALVLVASTMWWAQHRGLCEYGPLAVVHGESCQGT
ncbi:MAG: hypothetical protein JWM90_1806 [Thermoleophilia bacterium]|nr:hypothetical protein [Thermoleophilia bacterium]